MPEAKKRSVNTLICNIPDDNVAGPITRQTSRTPGWFQSHTNLKRANPCRINAGSWMSHCARAPTSVAAAKTRPPSMAKDGAPICPPSCHQRRPTPSISARLDISGEIAGIQNSSAALSEPKPRPISPAKNAIGAMTCNCTTAISCNCGLRPGPTNVINGSAASTNNTVTTRRSALTVVFSAARMCAPSSRGRRLRTLTMAL